jgi:hypothetical protein
MGRLRFPEQWEDEEGLHLPVVEEELVIEKRLVAGAKQPSIAHPML